MNTIQIEPLNISEEDKAFIEIRELQTKLIALAWGIDRLPTPQPRVGPSPLEKVYEILKAKLSIEEYNRLVFEQRNEIRPD